MLSLSATGSPGVCPVAVEDPAAVVCAGVVFAASVVVVWGCGSESCFAPAVYASSAVALIFFLIDSVASEICDKGLELLELVVVLLLDIVTGSVFVLASVR